jgi:ComF family protein
VSRWRWFFSSSPAAAASDRVPFVRVALRALFSLLFPGECRVCDRPLEEISRVPVCRKCLAEPAPLDAEFFCSSCRTPFQNGFPLDAEGRCALCRSGLRGFDAAYCYGSYEGALRRLIHVYKYSRVRTLAGPLGDFLSAALAREESWDVVTAVPLHWRKRWERGFNQSGLLAKELARRSGIPYAPLLKRIRATPAQASLSNHLRRHNVASAFACRRAVLGGEKLAGKRVLLIDDVLTTGATAAACARTLKKGGASRVAVLTLARVDRRWDVRLPAGKHPQGTAAMAAAAGSAVVQAPGPAMVEAAGLAAGGVEELGVRF